MALAMARGDNSSKVQSVVTLPRRQASRLIPSLLILDFTSSRSRYWVLLNNVTSIGCPLDLRPPIDSPTNLLFRLRTLITARDKNTDVCYEEKAGLLLVLERLSQKMLTYPLVWQDEVMAAFGMIDELVSLVLLTHHMAGILFLSPAVP
ncbi:hypothetical protein MUK42_33862 [Musa troglodytarum]|uniref:Uncharacterized protein n=1 Tax=Musa troglodytarum TaxID=320322 RepID=A0A9E7HJ62_9LILI|nr:hypothetical protein MUK42_33862 [Musa troglodytarum]